MKVDISELCGELHYASIKPRIICETFLEDRPGKPLNDYKVYCFDGQGALHHGLHGQDGAGRQVRFL